MRPFAPLLLAVVLASSSPLAQTFRSRADGVRVDVLVTQNGHPVRGLRAADFELRDEGVLQRIALVDVDKIPLNVVLILDSSGSVGGEPMNFIRSAARGFVRALNGGVSHSPDELSSPEDVALAVDVLTDALDRLASS